ncbi:MAG TPA: methyltransferase [Candidatus Magasanikbacteria bacterium]|nr:methyltransferase [Candidatus Magasanikbacteria bacterium]
MYFFILFKNLAITLCRGLALPIVMKRIMREGHEAVLPRATYAPWRTDVSFLSCYQKIKSFTLVDIYRCYELWQLVQQTKKLDGALIEVGVWRGGTGAIIAQRTKEMGDKNPVYLCDTFQGVVKTSAHDTYYKGGEWKNTSGQIVQQLLSGLGLIDSVRILQGIFPEETGHAIQEQKIKFCHIDVDVYTSAKDITTWIWDKLVVGGILVYDDFGFPSCDGVRKLVHEEYEKNDRIIIHNLNGHAVVIKIR